MPEEPPTEIDRRIPRYIEVAEKLRQGEFDSDWPHPSADDIGRLGEALRALSQTLESRSRESNLLGAVVSDVNAGIWLDDVLERVYRDFRGIIPYDRIGFSLIEDSPNGRIARARWAKSSAASPRIGRGFSAPLEGSSLAEIVATGRVRVLNDLPAYLASKPDSLSTRLIVEEGMRSSLTCPLIANGVPIGFMFFSSTRAGTYAQAHVELFTQIAGQLSVIVEKGRLLSELAAHKQEIEARNRELSRLNELKNSFLGMAAHDLRNPIAAIKMTVEALLEDDAELTPVERRELLQRIDVQSGQMLALLSDLLDVTQIESGHLSLTKEPVVLGDILAEAAARHGALAAPKRTQVVLEATAPGQILADPLRLRQVLDNLLSNAVKYSPPGSTVRIGAERIAGECKIAVRDQGPGISSAERQRLFEEFARLSARPTGGEKSTGLGLAIARRVVTAHGGRIGVDDAPGGGSIFWFTIPAG